MDTGFIQKIRDKEPGNVHNQHEQSDNEQHEVHLDLSDRIVLRLFDTGDTTNDLSLG
jgi:hypothetical protein